MPNNQAKLKLTYPQILIELWAPPSQTLDEIEHFREMLIDDIKHAAKHLPADWKIKVADIDDSAQPVEEALERFGDAVVTLTRATKPKRTAARKVG